MFSGLCSLTRSNPYIPRSQRDRDLVCIAWTALYVVYVRIKLQFSSYEMFVVKGTRLISSHQYSVQHFYKVFFYPYSISTPPSSFSFQSYFLFFNYFILYVSISKLQLTHAVLDFVFFVCYQNPGITTFFVSFQ